MSAETVLIVLPLPDRILSPNVTVGSRGSRMEKYRVSKEYRAAAKLAAEELRVESGPWERATVAVRWFHTQKRRRDDVNYLASLKPAYDGLVDAGLLVDDDHEHLTTLPSTFSVSREDPRVELLVTRIA